MSSKVFSSAIIGLNAEPVEVEADIGGGEIGRFSIVGLPDTSVSEARERVRSAIKNTGLNFPKLKITVNLAPADLRKQGSAYDLPIAISVLVASGIIKSDLEFNRSLFVGELALSGNLRAITGILPIAIMAKKLGFKSLYLPKENAREAKLVEDIDVFPVDNLLQLVLHLNKKTKIQAKESKKFQSLNKNFIFNFEDIKGQEQAKRAMEISAGGAHNILMTGPPGSGKTLIAKSMPSILPELLLEEALEITKIYSVAGELPKNQSLINIRPFRSPHHTASGVALVGGGTWPKPGEISLAHRGVLFLDEFAEFPRNLLENLRQPLEDGVISISRVSGTLKFPAKFILVGAMNPCPCGFYSDPDRECVCSPNQIINYRKKISGPILDRIDLHIEVPRIDFQKLSSLEKGEKSNKIRERIENARRKQLKRFAKLNIFSNSEMNSKLVNEFCPIDLKSKKILNMAVEKLKLSARSYFRILKLSRTIADLEDEEKILSQHIAEALQYRKNF